ncbi:cytochrome b/b6 domain-containing protein [Mesoterricola silvestris]|uniref:Cytochrome b561 bacterial/Ni-hydrogenase domain-containing protein n=1 Tax=Mesoterricola silvestris TaxID=2927979 RepID=A0AA48K934_9BACT|nr:cytochrome b/b6 domain-containing protein [Mesoterricola silvestris]BDU73594.1 hypothetical protein METEAL_27680 [Mesoterricola silvestris]
MIITSQSHGNPAGNDAAPQQALLWDWPTRITHGLTAGLFAGAFLLATLTSKHSQVFLIHSLLGLVLALVVVLRLGWGVVGSRPSRFSSFLFSPLALFRYLRDAARGQDQPAAGHNPGSSYASYAMLLIPLGLAATGLAQGRGGEWAEEVHEALAYAMVAFIVLHLLGLALYGIRHRENIALSMLHGRRRIPAGAGIPSSRPWAGLAVLLLVAGGAGLLAQGLDLKARQIKVPGLAKPIPLGEREKEGAGKAPEQDENEDEEKGHDRD